MSVHTTWTTLTETVRHRGAGLWLLVDPDKTNPRQAADTTRRAVEHGCDAVLLGASTGSSNQFAQVARAVHQAATCPVLLFPNGASQVVPHADAILFMSLLSGRNPRYLIEEQVKGAPLVQHHGLEAIATAYLLIESGHPSSVQQISDTQPIPRDATDQAFAHLLAARYMGMSLAYLEAGSGAAQSVPPAMVEGCRTAGMTMAVGGGIRDPESAFDLVNAGASFVVVGNHFEKEPDWNLFSEMAHAVHSKETIHAAP